MPNPPAVAPRGGPQPAKKKNWLNDLALPAINRAASGAPPPPEMGNTAATPAEAIAIRHSAAVDAITKAATSQADIQWKPTSKDLYNWLYAEYGNIARPRGDSYQEPFNDPKGLLGDPAKLDAILNSAKTPAELAQALGYRVENLAPLFQAAATTNAAIDQAGQAALDQINQSYNKATPAARGGSTPDSIDRPQDPFSMLTPADSISGMTPDQLSTLVSQLDANGSYQRSQMLDSIKQQVVQDTAMAMADSQRLAAVYQAGLQGKPMPAVPMPGESAAQGRYATAKGGAAQVAMPTVVAPQLDTSGAERQILMAAKGIELQRQQEKNQSVIDLITSQQKDAAAAQKEAEAAQKQAQKQADREQQKLDQANLDAQLRSKFAEKLTSEAVSNLGGTLIHTGGGSTQKVDDKYAKASYGKAKTLFESGGNYRDVVREVFPESLDINGDPQLTPGQLRVLQAAQFAAGKTPDELANAWGAYRTAGRAHFSQNGG